MATGTSLGMCLHKRGCQETPTHWQQELGGAVASLCLGTAAGRCLSLSEPPRPPRACPPKCGWLSSCKADEESCAARSLRHSVLAHPSRFRASSNHAHHTNKTEAKRGKEACPKLWCGVTWGASEAELACDRIPVFPFTSSVSLDESLSP